MECQSRISRDRNSPLAVAVAAVALLSGCSAPPAVAQGSDAPRAGVWWNDAKLVKNVITSFLGIRAGNEGVAANTGFGSDVIDLLLLFDSWDKPDDLRALASLSSYYLGAHGGETYSCLVVRKGRPILPELKREMEGRPTECSERYSEGTGICLSEERRSSRLKAMIDSIEAGQGCIVER